MRASIAHDGNAGNGGQEMADLFDPDDSGLLEPCAIDVLVVEDSDTDFRIISTTLQLMDTFRVNVHHAGTIAQARGLARTTRPDVALVDFQLGIDTGVRAIRELGGREGGTAVILVTGMPGQEIAQIALRAGAIHCLDKKHLSPVHLETTIRSALYTHALETRLQKTIMDLERANIAKAGFCARMGHDLKVPLNAVLGYAQMMEEQSPGEIITQNFVDRARDIHVAGSHLLEILDNLVFHSAGGDSALAEPYRSRNLAELVTTAVSLVESAARARGHEIVLSDLDDAAVVNCQPSIFTQAVVNILSNAIKYTSPGGTIDVCVAYAGRWSEVRVSDNGIGMSKDDVSVALLPFGRVDLPPEFAQNGTGIGLPIVRDILKAHAGQIEIESAPDVGTTVTLRLPAMGEDQHAA